MNVCERKPDSKNKKIEILLNWRNKSILNHIEHWLIFICTVTGYVSISTFASLVGMTLWITSSAIGLKVSVITAGIKNYKSIIRKKKKYDKIVSKLNSIEVLISKVLID